MRELFARYLEAGIFGSVIILVILLLRLFLRKAPRRMLCLLWLLAAIRLLLPFQLESRLSLQPDLDHAADAVQQIQLEQIDLPVTDIAPVAPTVSTDIPQTQPVTIPPDAAQTPVDPMRIVSVIWICVACASLVYLILSYGLLKFRVREAVKSEDGVMECDKIRGAFLLGYLKPRIYLPFHVSNRDRSFIIAHERAHIARGDNWWKLLGFLCAGIHWYNPLVWLAYVLLCRDIELACDEKVIRELNLDQRKAYSMALLNCGKSLAGVSVCPVAFGEVSLKTRIKKVLRYRKPGVWITVISLVLVTAVAVCFLTSPMAEALPQKEIPEETQPSTESVPDTTIPNSEFNEPEITYETLPATGVHRHAYLVKTVAPTCTEKGYDLYSCTCGVQYTDNLVEPIGHQYFWAEANYSENRMLAKCANCMDEFWQTVPLNYSDTGSVEERLYSYAAAYGFNVGVFESYSTVVSFSYSVQSNGELSDSKLVTIGQQKIDEAYDYCRANGLSVSDQICSIDVYYTAAGNGSAPTVDLIPEIPSIPSLPVIKWDLSPSPQSTMSGYSGSFGSSSTSNQIRTYHIDIYIALMQEVSVDWEATEEATVPGVTVDFTNDRFA